MSPSQRKRRAEYASATVVAPARARKVCVSSAGMPRVEFTGLDEDMATPSIKKMRGFDPSQTAPQRNDVTMPSRGQSHANH